MRYTIEYICETLETLEKAGVNEHQRLDALEELMNLRRTEQALNLHSAGRGRPSSHTSPTESMLSQVGCRDTR